MKELGSLVDWDHAILSEGKKSSYTCIVQIENLAGQLFTHSDEIHPPSWYFPILLDYIADIRERFCCVWKNTRMSNYRANGAKSLPISSQKFRTIFRIFWPKVSIKNILEENLSVEAVPMSSGEEVDWTIPRDKPLTEREEPGHGPNILLSSSSDFLHCVPLPSSSSLLLLLLFLLISILSDVIHTSTSVCLFFIVPIWMQEATHRSRPAKIDWERKVSIFFPKDRSYGKKPFWPPTPPTLTFQLCFSQMKLQLYCLEIMLCRQTRRKL